MSEVGREGPRARRVEVSALRYSPGSLGLHGKTPLLRLQSDERLIAFIRRGNHTAFEVLFSRYQSRLLAFCRHLLGSKEDAEDVLQEVMTAAFNAILADNRQINVRPWLYRIARNRSLNHLRRAQAIGVDSMDIHFSENGASTADKVHDREQFRLLVGDIQELPETQRTALVLREMDALSYDQIAEAMETTVPGVKSLLVRARIALAEAAEARQLSCEDVRIELGEVAEGLRKKPDALARRHLRSCDRCSSFQGQLKKTNKALAALLPIGPLAALKHFALFHVGHSAGTGSSAAGTTAGAGGAGATGAGATGAGATTAGATAGATTAGATAGATTAGAGMAGASFVGSAGSALSAGAGALAGKAAAGLAAAAIVTAGAVEATHTTHHRQFAAAPIVHAGTIIGLGHRDDVNAATKSRKAAKHHAKLTTATASKTPVKSTPATSTAITTATKPAADNTTTTPAQPAKPTTAPGRGQVTTDPTVLTSQPSGSGSTGSASSSPDSSSGSSSTTTPADSGSSGSGTTTGTTGTTGPSGPSGSSDPSSGGVGVGPTGAGGSGSSGGDSSYPVVPLPNVLPSDSITGG
jgi:RNA polymerase sigma factor (sigma-70 family)